MGQKKGSAKGRRTRRDSLQIVLLALLIAGAAIAFVALQRPEGDHIAGATPEPTRLAKVFTPEPTPEVTPSPTPRPTAPLTPVPTPTPTPEPTPDYFRITAVGDCTIGGDMLGSTERTFRNTVTKDGAIDYDYCFKNVKPIFEEDDLTIANLEVVLTKSNDYLHRYDKIFIMRGEPEYVNMLTGSSIEICNIANNHMTDFGDAGIEEMAQLLTDNGIGFCGYGYTHIEQVRGMKIGFLGFNYWTTKESDFRSMLTDMRAQCDIMIVSIHWGVELEYYPVEEQRKWGHIAVDLGADLVLGHHPHVIEGMETYNGVNIIYSLGNFCFGGNTNPRDKDTFIYQHEFKLDIDGSVTTESFKVIPCKITSVPYDGSNNFQPTPIADEGDQKRLLKRIEEYSARLSNPIKLVE